MCLVSYIPLKGGFVLSSNRDEAPSRNAGKIIEEDKKQTKIYYPGDHAGGSWIVISEDNRLVCLLNGAFENHERMLPYRMSRGIMMKEFFQYSDSVDFLQHYNCQNIEPFTMVIKDSLGLFEFVWDGQKKYVQSLDLKKQYIWSSATLYNASQRAKRSDWLEKELRRRPSLTSEALLAAHLLEDPKDIGNSLKMNRNSVVQTISHTQVYVVNETATLKHLNLLTSDEISPLKLSFIL